MHRFVIKLAPIKKVLKRIIENWKVEFPDREPQNKFQDEESNRLEVTAVWRFYLLVMYYT